MDIGGGRREHEGVNVSSVSQGSAEVQCDLVDSLMGVRISVMKVSVARPHHSH